MPLSHFLIDCAIGLALWVGFIALGIAVSGWLL